MPTDDKPAEAKPAATAAKAEISAMENAYEALKALDGSARVRARQWLNDRLRADETQNDPWDQEPPF